MLIYKPQNTLRQKSTCHTDYESVASSMERVSQITLLQLTSSLFSQVLIHGISDHIGWVTTMATHVGLIPISLDAFSITFRDRPFVNGSARFLAVWI